MAMLTLKRKLTALLFSVILTSTTSCGYFLYPDRVGQTSGKIDSTVVILDTLGLLLGIVPGLVAFAVDLSTGAIYLPPGGKSAIEQHQNRLSFDPPKIDPKMLNPKYFNDLPLQEINAKKFVIDREYLAEHLSSLIGIELSPEQLRLYRAQESGITISMIQAD